MFSRVFLAMTAGEMKESAAERMAYMALHFSPYSTGLSNPPQTLPENSILLLDDSMQIADHDPALVVQQLKKLVVSFSAQALLLDFQREVSAAAECMVSNILQALPCPVAATEAYARKLHCPVFLPPPPVNKPLVEYLSPWLEQGVYLEIAPDCLAITVTENGSAKLQICPVQSLPLEDKRLHCHYRVEAFPEKAIVTMCRYREDLQQLVNEAEQLGVLGCVGLYKELKT